MRAPRAVFSRNPVRDAGATRWRAWWFEAVTGASSVGCGRRYASFPVIATTNAADEVKQQNAKKKRKSTLCSNSQNEAERQGGKEMRESIQCSGIIKLMRIL